MNATFTPYTGTDVDRQSFTQVVIPGWGKVWAAAHKASRDTFNMVGVPYIVTILGHGSQPFIDWNKLPKSVQDKLLGESGGLIKKGMVIK